MIYLDLEFVIQMLRTRNYLKSIQLGCRLRQHSVVRSLASSASDQSPVEGSYSLPYTYHTPQSILKESLEVDVEKFIDLTTAEATSIEEITRKKTAFDMYRDLLLDSGAHVKTPDTHVQKENLQELFKRQLDLEQELRHTTAVESMKNILKLQDMGKSANLKSVQKVLLEWYEPFVACLDEKIEAFGTMHKLKAKLKNTRNDKKIPLWKAQLREQEEKHNDLTKHGPILNLISTEKLAVITMNAVVNHILSSGNKANAAVLCKDIGDVIETEVNLAKQTGERLWMKSWQKEQTKDAAGKPQIVKALGRQIRKYYGML